jgi:hypothetical protein
MSGSNIRVIDLPDLGTVTDASSFVIDKNTATGRFSALAVKTYCATTTLPEAPSNNTPYGRMNAAWTPVLADAPSNGLSYARLNATWSPVVPEAPLTGTIYGRGSSGWTSVLPISGGTISGNLGTTGNMTVGSNLYTNTLSMSSANGYEWIHYVSAGSGDHVEQHRANWFQVWTSSNGTWGWNSPNGTCMTLDGGGALSVKSNASVGGTLAVTGDISGVGASSSISVPGNITGSTAVWNVPNAFGFAPGGLGRKFFFGAAYYWEWNQSSGQMNWVSNGTPMWNMRASDGLCFNSVAAVGGVGPYLNTSDRRTKTNIMPSTKGLTEILQLQPVAFTRADPTTGAQDEIGFVAQDVQPIVPEAVWQAGIPLKDGTGGLDTGDPTLAISESTIAAISVNAIKELNNLITALTARIAALEGTP